MDTEYAGICGITKEELVTEMHEDIQQMADVLGLSYDKTLEKLKENYDGYHFAWPSSDIFNPYSLLTCFSKRKVDSYWFGSGTPTYLLNMMRKYDFTPIDLGEQMDASKDDFDAATETMTTIMPLLYQSGYITIKNYDPETELYTLALPNKEVRIGCIAVCCRIIWRQSLQCAIRPWPRCRLLSIRVTWMVLFSY